MAVYFPLSNRRRFDRVSSVIGAVGLPKSCIWRHDSGHGFGHGYGYSGSVVRVYPSFGWGWGWGAPYWYGYYPYYYPYGYYYEDTGTLKIENAVKTDEVYINGSLVGSAKDNKTLHLNPGSYRVTVKHSGRDVIDQSVYIIRGKTIKLDIGDKY